MKFDKSDVLKNFVEKLSDITLLPKPHLNVFNTKYPEKKKGGLFTYSDKPASQNLIGYDFIIKSVNEQSVTSTNFDFYVRNGEIKKSIEKDLKNFIHINVRIDSLLDKNKSKIKITNLDNGEVIKEGYMVMTNQKNDKTFFKFEWKHIFKIKFKKFKKDMQEEADNEVNIIFKKNIKKLSDDKFRVQVRITNEKENNYQKGIGLIVNDEEGYHSTALGVLLNYKISETCDNAFFFSIQNKWEADTAVKSKLNINVQKEDRARIDFSEYFIGKEKIAAFQEGKPKLEFRSDLEKEGLLLSKEVVEAYQHIKNFWKYQEMGIKAILKELKYRSGNSCIISVRTAGGKTETFTVPLLQYCLERIHLNGVKSLIFYPTKALANDQASRIFRDLYFLNKLLEKGGKRKITVGIYHGDIKKRSEDDKEVWIPFRCPNPKCDRLIKFKQEGIKNIAYCPKCNEILDYLILTRYEIHRSLPDIIITNQDTLHYTMLHYPENHSILGKEIKYCQECGCSFIHKRICPKCNKDLILVKPDCFPNVIIMDEIHMLGGAFGINTSFFLKRLNKLISIYANKETKPVYIGATATIKNPRKFTSELFGVSKNKIMLIPPENCVDIYKDEIQSNLGKEREYLFIMPKAYDSADTLAYGISFTLSYFCNKNIEEKPTILGFCESIKDNRNLIKLTNARKPKIQGRNFEIAGHTSQYEKDLRAEIEKGFTEKKIDVLYATSTLEVGVDFEDINILLLHGAPYSFNDFLQRVGRSARKKDAAVVVTLRKWSALDYFYFDKSKPMLENPDAFIVDPPFNARNVVILRNHIISSFFDFMCSSNKSEKISKISELKKEFGNDESKFTNKSKEEIIKYIVSSLRLTEQIDLKLVNETLTEIEKGIFVPSNIQTVDDLIEHFEDKYQINGLRISDKVVEVEFQI